MYFLASTGQVNKTQPGQKKKRKESINKDCHSSANLGRLTPPFLSGSVLSNLQVHQFTFYAPPSQLNEQASVIVDTH